MAAQGDISSFEAVAVAKGEQEASANPMMQIAKSMQTAVVVPAEPNVDTNRKLWDAYASEWSAEAPWVQKMANNLGMSEEATHEHLKVLGTEWARDEELEAVIEKFFSPHLNAEAVVGEVGSGGGRVALLLAPYVAKFTCFDISEGMLEVARSNLSEQANVSFELLVDATLPKRYEEQPFDFLYWFDVLVHVDLHTQWRYISQLPRLLKVGGKSLLHTANLATDAGFERFAQQKNYSVGGFYFMTPQAVDSLIERAGNLRIVQRSTDPEFAELVPENIYVRRDYMVVVERTA